MGKLACCCGLPHSSDHKFKLADHKTITTIRVGVVVFSLTVETEPVIAIETADLPRIRSSDVVPDML